MNVSTSSRVTEATFSGPSSGLMCRSIRPEGQPRFGRDDLKPYFAKAKITPAANYDRDFVEAVRKGWIHEEGSESYLTTKGIEAIESDFEGERKYVKGRKLSKNRKPKRSQAKQKQSRRA
jgi:hypothetical protein